MDHQARLLTSPQQPAGSTRLPAKITRRNLRARGGKHGVTLPSGWPVSSDRGTWPWPRPLADSTSSRRIRAVGKKMLAGKAAGNAGSSPGRWVCGSKPDYHVGSARESPRPAASSPSSATAAARLGGIRALAKVLAGRGTYPRSRTRTAHWSRGTSSGELPVQPGVQAEGDPDRLRPDRSPPGQAREFSTPCCGGRRLGFGLLPRCGHDGTGRSGTHRPVRSLASRRHTSRPVPGIGRPKLCA